MPLTLIAGIGHWLMGSVDFSLMLALLAGSIPGIIVGSLSRDPLVDSVLRSGARDHPAPLGGQVAHRLGSDFWR